jgi:hypothetical protein
MRGGWGGDKALLWGVALSTAACTGALPPSLEAPVSETRCSLVEAPTTTADPVTIVIDAVGITREACGLTLAARALRPWPTSSSGPWTVLLTVTAEGVTARRLGSEEARDAIDAGRTLLATDDADLVAYAAARTDLEVAPLPWDRTYLSLRPDSATSLGDLVGPDAVRADARHADPLTCDALPSGESRTATSPRSGRVLYADGDHTARELAERVVALAPSRDAIAAGVDSAGLEISLRRGDALAYIVSVPLASKCDALALLARRAPWIVSRMIHPLVDTRAHAIVSRASQP